MKLRSIAMALAATTLASGFASVPALAAAAHPGGQVPAAARHVASPVATAAHTGVITGFVAGAGGAPLAGACVVATGPAGGGMAMTARDGRYVISPVRPGRYTVHASDCSAPGRYLDVWSGGTLSPAGASKVTVAAGQVRQVARLNLRPIAGAQARIAAAIGGIGSAPRNPVPAAATRRPIAGAAAAAGTGAIAGSVTGRGKPLANICVYALPAGRGRLGRAETSAAGRYRIGKLPAGRYYVRFVPCSRTSNWLWQIYRGINGYNSRVKPRKVPVTTGKTTHGIDAALRLGGEIDGTVRNSAGQALGKICVEAVARSGRRYIFFQEARSATNGRYALHALEPASYQVRFSLGCGNKGNYAPVWWRHSLGLAHATKIPVSYGSVVANIDPVMPRGGEISGVVKAADGKLLRGVCVYAFTQGHGALTRSGTDGRYALVGLTTGRYQLWFYPCMARGNYLPLKRSARVKLGGTVSGFDAVLPTGAIVSGVATDSGGHPLAGICVVVQGNRRGYGGARTGSDGSYSVDGLTTGSYTVHFSGGCGNSGSYAPQYYGGQANVAEARHVELTQGQATSGIDAAMQPGATITGAVSGPGGVPLSDLCIGISGLPGSQYGFIFTTIVFASNGSYSAANLTPGLYTVDFGCFSGTRTLARQWFRSAPDLGGADLVSAPAGVVTSGISAQLQPGGSVTGTVTNRAGQPLSAICVTAQLSGSQPDGFAGPDSFSFTNTRGAYRFRNLPAGSYAVHFTDCRNTSYGGRWYDRRATLAAATPVTVTAGGSTTGIDEVLSPGGSIAGRVTSGGKALPGACVIAYDAAAESYGWGRADPTGHYTIAGLGTGAYQLTFYPCQPARAKLAPVVRPTPVAVTAPGAVTGINASIGGAGSITGAVLGSPDGRPRANVCAVAVPVTGDGVAMSGHTGRHGNYVIRDLAAGTYHVYIGDPFCPSFRNEPGFAPQWYDGQATEAAAADVTVSAGAITSGIGATLGTDGTIAGTVTQSATPVAGECVTAYPVGAAPDPLSGEVLRPVTGVTGNDGTYSLVGLLPGSYQVEFSVGCGDSGWATQWWQDAASQASATPVVVSASGTVTGIDASLQP